MDDKVQAVLEIYHARIADEREKMRAAFSGGAKFDFRTDALLAVGPDTGRLMNIIVRSLKAPHVLEIGTSFGYSGIWLAEAAQAAGGRMTTLEMQPHKHQYAREMSAKAGLAEVVDFQLGDAVELIEAMPAGIDFVLLDLWKDLYVPCLEAFYPKLNPGAVIVADNMDQGDHVIPYQQAVRGKPHMSSILLPVGSTIEISRYEPVAA